MGNDIKSIERYNNNLEALKKIFGHYEMKLLYVALTNVNNKMTYSDKADFLADMLNADIMDTKSNWE